MTICIIGGGLTGCLTALELAEAGRRVVLLEKEDNLIARASLANEGKIHLGFVYAADPSFRTAARMVDDALMFRPVLERWISPEQFEDCLYDCFDYGVPRDSMLPVEAIRRHFAAVSDYLSERSQATGQQYLGQRDAEVVTEKSTLRPAMLTEFATGERGVWPALIAQHVAEAVVAHPGIEVRTGTRVTSISSEGGRWKVQSEGPFEAVVNCAWAARRHLDATAGFQDDTAWLYRYKFGVLLEDASEAMGGTVPRNSTAVLGSYGDSVYHAGEDVLYCSWYPVGMCYSAATLSRDDRPAIGDPQAAIEATWRGYATLDPAYEAALQNADRVKARVIGDYIAAKARTDIDDPDSLLHTRGDHGPVQLAPGYWTVETGKYASAARCANDCAGAILGRG